MIQTDYSVNFLLAQKAEYKYKADIVIDKHIVHVLYQEIVKSHKKEVSTAGFAKGQTPLYYIEQNYRVPILEHLKEFLFFHYVINALYSNIYKHKLIIVGEPELTHIDISQDYKSLFEFTLIHSEPTVKNSWKNLPFKAPERKNYKDLDRQVENFMKEEAQFAIEASSDAIAVGDWVCFSMALVNEQHEPLLGNYVDKIWLKIGDEDADQDAKDLLLGKKVGDSFYSKNIFLQSYVSNQLDTSYIFLIKILERVAQSSFSFELFKKHFKTKSAREMHQKLIEVFSYRNDLSQRREMVEATFKLLNQQFICKLPTYLIDQQEERVLKAVHSNPDYHVYKSQSDFKQRVRQLAEKQLKQAIIIDYIAYQEDIDVSSQDIASYLNFTIRPRMKEFLYFDLPSTKIRGQEQPVPEEILKRYCLREKTLNHIIYNLTKKS